MKVRVLHQLVPDMRVLRDEAPIVTPLVMGWGVSLLGAVSLVRVLGDVATPVDIGSVVWIAALSTPIVSLAKALLLLAVLSGIFMLAARDLHLRVLLSGLLYGQVIAGLDALLLAGWLRSGRASDWLAAPSEHAVPLTVAAWLPASDAFGSFGWRLLGSLGPLHLLWMLWMAWVLHRGAGLGRTGALALSGVVLLLRLAFATLSFMPGS